MKLALLRNQREKLEQRQRIKEQLKNEKEDSKNDISMSYIPNKYNIIGNGNRPLNNINLPLFSNKETINNLISQSKKLKALEQKKNNSFTEKKEIKELPKEKTENYKLEKTENKIKEKNGISTFKFFNQLKNENLNYVNIKPNEANENIPTFKKENIKFNTKTFNVNNNNLKLEEPDLEINVEKVNFQKDNIKLNKKENQIENEINKIYGREYENIRSSYSFKDCSNNCIVEYSYTEDQNIENENTMEDKGKSIENFNNNKNEIVFELFDGHGGEEISFYLQKNFDEIYKNYLIENEYDIKKSLKDCFIEINEQIRNLEIENMGSTGCIIHLIYDNNLNKLKIYCGNIGDTSTTSFSKDKITRLSYDHRISDKEEKKRVIFRGGKIINERLNGVLMLSRCFGDFELEEHGLICDPFINEIEVDLNIKNQMLILACDGIWDLVNEDDILKMINKDSNTENLTKKIIKCALDNSAWDNLSVFAIKLS